MMNLTEKVMRAFASTGRHAMESLMVEMAARIMELETRAQQPESPSIALAARGAKKPAAKPAKKSP